LHYGTGNKFVIFAMGKALGASRGVQGSLGWMDGLKVRGWAFPRSFKAATAWSTYLPTYLLLKYIVRTYLFLSGHDEVNLNRSDWN
jgi:hypothetical protein